ncbi:MAG: hypothetical protein ABJC05_04485 [Pyrinomonadaceae bacterium]
MFKLNSKQFAGGVLSMLLGLSLAGCSKQEEKPTTGEAPRSGGSPQAGANASPAPAATLASSAPAIATAEGETSGVRAEVQELKRGSDSTLTLKFSIVNGSDKNLSFGYDFGDEANHIKDYDSIGGVTLVDGANKKKYFVVRDTESNCVCSRGVKDLKPQTRANLWAKFPAPPDEVQKIGVVIPHFGPLDDVPISR